MHFDRIPHEMRAYPSWVLWRYEERDGSSKPTKVPYSPRFHTLASVTNSASWGTYDEAVAAHSAGGFSGIGFVLTNDDPFAFIDLDDTKGDQAANDLQRGIFDAFDSYAERSPSGKGLHIIVKGAVARGARRESIEVYSSARYMTMTGDVYRDAPINDCGDLLHTLWAQMAGPRSDTVRPIDGPASEADQAIIDRMFAAANGAKARDLYEGEWQKHFGSQSEADFALIDIVAFYSHSPNREQIARIFRSSALGRRGKADRDDYVHPMIDKAFDKKPLFNIDVSTAIANANAMIEAKKAAIEAGIPTFDDEPDERLPTVDMGDLDGRDVAPREWLVEGMIPAGNVTLLTGDGGSGKSLLALQLCASTVLGRSWIGTKPITKGRAFYLSAEDDVPEVHRRMSDIASAERVSMRDLRGLTVAALADRDALLAIPGRLRGTLDPTPLYEALAARLAALKPSLIVIDTLADTFGGNEIERGPARQFVAMLRRLAIEFGATIVVLAHPSREGIKSERGDSGSTGWSNSVRSRLYLMRDEAESDLRTLELKKSNYGTIGNQIRLQWWAGAFRQIGQAESQSAHKEATRREIDNQFVEFLTEAIERGQTLSAAPSSPHFAPKRFAAQEGAKGNKFAFNAAMSRLFGKGRIAEVMSEGPPSKRKAVLALSEPATPPANPVPSPSNSPATPPANLF